MFIIIFLLSMVSSQSPIGTQIFSQLRSELAKISLTVPLNYQTLISNIHSEAEIISDSFQLSQLDDILIKKHNLPSEIVSKFHNILFSSSLTFQSFVFTLQHNTGQVSEYIGTARNINGVADIAFSHGLSTGTTVIQYQTIQTRNCHRVLFWKKCHTNNQSIPRGFTAQELETILNTLRAFSYKKINEELIVDNPSISMFDRVRVKLLSENIRNFPINNGILKLLGAANDNETPMVTNLIQSVLKKEPELQKDLKNNKSPVVDRIINRGFTNFQQTATIEQYLGVDDEYIDLFLKGLKEDLKLPEVYESSFDSTIKDILWSDSNIWIAFDISFSIDGGAFCKYVCVLARHDDKIQKIDWLVANVKATFALANNLLIIQKTKSVLGGLWGNTEEKIINKPASLTKQEMTTVFEFFQIITFKRFAEIYGVKPFTLLISIPEIKPLGQIAEVLTSIELAKLTIKGVALLWKGVTHIFSSKTSTEIKGSLLNTGYEYFAASAQVQKLEGLKEKYFEAFQNELFRRLELPNNRSLDLKYILKDLEYSDAQTWNTYEMVFNVGEGGDCKYVAILANHNKTEEKINFLITDVRAKFKLANNLLVIKESKSVAGIVYSEENWKLKEIPRNIDQNEVNDVFTFFKIVAFKNFGDLLGVDISFPQS